MEIKKNAKAGDAVVFLARVGGRVKPFAEKQAIFVAADPSLKSCELMSTEDYCTMPWDYCCTSREDLRMGTATIRILGADGRPVATSAQGAGGLEPLKFIVVEGTVSDRNDEGLFVWMPIASMAGGKPTYEEPQGKHLISSPGSESPRRWRALLIRFALGVIDQTADGLAGVRNRVLGGHRLEVLDLIGLEFDFDRVSVLRHRVVLLARYGPTVHQSRST